MFVLAALSAVVSLGTALLGSQDGRVVRGRRDGLAPAVAARKA